MARQVQIGIQRIQDHHRKFRPEVFQIMFRPVAVEARSTRDVFRERLSKITLANQDVPDQPSGVDVVDTAAGLASKIS